MCMTTCKINQPFNHFRYSSFTRLTHNQHHAILIGGGQYGKTVSRIITTRLPKLADHLDIEFHAKKFKEFPNLHKSSPRILFANGNTRFVNIYPGILGTIYSIFKATTNKISVEPLENLKGSATLNCIEGQFDDLAQIVNPKDHVWIYLSGQGRPIFGIVLWNNWFSTEFFSQKMLSQQLQKLPLDISTTVIVDSCYSELYHRLRSTKVSVFVTGNMKHPFWPNPKNLNENTAELIKNIQSSNLLIPFSTGSSRAGNFYATDSLSQFLEKSLKQDSMFYTVEMKWKFVKCGITRILVGNNPFIKSIITTSILAGALIFDVPNAIQYILEGELASIFSKTALPYLKTGALAIGLQCFPKTTYVIKSQLKQTSLYKNWHILDAQRLLQELPQNQSPVISPELSSGDQETMKEIFKALQELKTIRATDERLSHYYLLYDLAILFTIKASFEEIKEFIEIGKRILLSEKEF